jgi:hypothetical protein
MPPGGADADGEGGDMDGSSTEAGEGKVEEVGGRAAVAEGERDALGAAKSVSFSKRVDLDTPSTPPVSMKCSYTQRPLTNKDTRKIKTQQTRPGGKGRGSSLVSSYPSYPATPPSSKA